MKIRECNIICLLHGKDENGKNKKNNRLCRARGKLGSSWLLATTASMVFLNLCSSFSSLVLIIIVINVSVENKPNMNMETYDVLKKPRHIIISSSEICLLFKKVR